MPISRFTTAFQRQCALWILRAFCPSVGRHLFFETSRLGLRFADHDIAHYLGISIWDDDPSRVHVFKVMDKMLQSLELSNRAIGLPRQAKNNIDKFSQATGIHSDELKILKFFICLKIESVLKDTYQVLDGLLQRDPSRFLGKILNLPRSTVERALTSDGPLRSCGLISEKSSNGFEFDSERAARLLFYEKYDEATVMKEFGVTLPETSKLSLAQYPHLKNDILLLLAHLKQVTQQQNHGTNILLHGVPGTGKTQLSRAVGKEMGLPVFEVETSTKGMLFTSPEDRLKSLSFADTFLSNRPSLLVFDEAEDVFSASFTDRSVASTHKGWFNQMLERNRWPVFWISNTITGLDPAFARRFDMIIEVPVPPKAERLVIAESVVGDLIDVNWVNKIAAADTIAPAVLERAGKVIRSGGGKASRPQQGEAISRLLSSTLKAQGHADPFRMKAGSEGCKHYNLDFLNTAQDLGSIAEKLHSVPAARLCLYGPAGTGKTSFGHWLAAELDRPLIAKKASELLGPYVGMTERQIGEAFEEAESEGAILLLDEIDSFLSERTQSRKSWENTAVNEMLTRIESFPGIMIASTNRLEALDPASLRRFDLKLYFDYLRGEQVEKLLLNQCHQLGLTKPSARSKNLASNLTNCTPGDFALAARRHRFEPFMNADALVAAVSEEINYKSTPPRPIGFA